MSTAVLAAFKLEVRISRTFFHARSGSRRAKTRAWISLVLRFICNARAAADKDRTAAIIAVWIGECFKLLGHRNSEGVPEALSWKNCGRECGMTTRGQKTYKSKSAATHEEPEKDKTEKTADKTDPPLKGKRDVGTVKKYMGRQGGANMIKENTAGGAGSSPSITKHFSVLKVPSALTSTLTDLTAGGNSDNLKLPDLKLPDQLTLEQGAIQPISQPVTDDSGGGPLASETERAPELIICVQEPPSATVIPPLNYEAVGKIPQGGREAEERGLEHLSPRLTDPQTPDLTVENFFSVSDGSMSGTGNESLSSTESSKSEGKGSDPTSRTIQKKKARSKRRSQLKWDYSDSYGSLPLGASNCQHEASSLAADTPTEPSLTSIFNFIKQFQEEVRSDNLAAKGASKKLHGGIRKLNKICTDIGDRVSMVEGRTETLETEVSQVKEQGASHEACLIDLMTKLEEQENRLRKNNLRLLGIPEGVEGEDPRGYIVKLLRDAFPLQTSWNWDQEVQRAHRFPFNLKQRRDDSNSGGEKPRVFLVFFGNFLLRQLVYDQARPNSQKEVGGIKIFSKPDFCHATVERRWRLRQMITPLQQQGAQVYLMNPARLKVIHEGTTRVFLSEIKAGEYLKDIVGRKKK